MMVSPNFRLSGPIGRCVVVAMTRASAGRGAAMRELY
jgi:hypothetical protein